MTRLSGSYGTLWAMGDGEPIPTELNGNRLRWWNRLRWRAGMVPFRRCANGEHDIRNIYGDEIIFGSNGRRSRCRNCQKIWRGLNGTD